MKKIDKGNNKLIPQTVIESTKLPMTRKGNNENERQPANDEEALKQNTRSERDTKSTKKQTTHTYTYIHVPTR